MSFTVWKISLLRKIYIDQSKSISTFYYFPPEWYQLLCTYLAQ